MISSPLSVAAILVALVHSAGQPEKKNNKKTRYHLSILIKEMKRVVRE